MSRSSMEKRKRSLRQRKNTSLKRDFASMRTWFPERITIVSEGDSWFAYPSKWFIGKPPNLVSQISGWSRHRANFLKMASNGDEAVDMVSGKQKHELTKILRWHEDAKNRKPVDLLLFSGGGNDVVGSNDFERFIRPYKSGYSARQCLRIRRLTRKIKQIGLAYEELLDIRDHYSPTTLVMTHTYDYPFASLQGANFLGGLIKTEGWMKRFMDEIQIPDSLQTAVIREVMDTMAEEILAIAQSRPGFIAVDTRGTLMDKENWENEIHPDEDGFTAIADRMYSEMEIQFPTLKRN